MRGAFAPRQSSVAKEKEIMQGMSTQSEYINNYMHFTLNLTQLVADLIPFLIKENELIQIDDEFGNKKYVEVNKEDYDWEGKAINVLNDLNAVRYRIVPAIGDDSPTSREQDLKNFVQIMEAIGNSIFKLMEISPRMVAGFLASWQNRYAKETAKFLLEHADQVEQQQSQQGQAELQQQQEKMQMKYDTDMTKIRTPILQYKVSPQDIQEAPFGFQIMMAMAEKLRNGEGAASNPQGGGSVPRESPPAAPPQGEMPPEVAMQQQMMSAGAQQPVAQ
jgi:Zn/Cd-binding protein ZinT